MHSRMAATELELARPATTSYSYHNCIRRKAGTQLHLLDYMDGAAAEPAAAAAAAAPAAEDAEPQDLLADIDGLDDVDWDACGEALSFDVMRQIVESDDRSAISPPVSPVQESEEPDASTGEPDAASSSTGGAGALSIVAPQPAQQSGAPYVMEGAVPHEGVLEAVNDARKAQFNTTLLQQKLLEEPTMRYVPLSRASFRMVHSSAGAAGGGLSVARRVAEIADMLRSLTC